ncbi:MAG: hypothetical protein GY814_03580 [Gammaproteobacteria bacterium]|nr:hypothetical protein [Gammaproteobacteria bacterium]
MPVEAEYQYLYIEAKGGDGGKATRCGLLGNNCDTGNGGVGATLGAVYTLGNGLTELAPGGRFRFIVGEKGTSRSGKGLHGGRSGDGGGGTGVFYRVESEPIWRLALVAGGGGGGTAASGGRKNHGLAADPVHESGTDGKGGNPGKGGRDGKGGGGGPDTYSGGGGGLLEGGGGRDGGLAGFAKYGIEHTAPTGGSGAGVGGFGVGSGGKGVSTNAGGGGGYSGGGGGGGYGNNDGGGGGGSWPEFSPSFISVNVVYRAPGQEDKSNTGSPANGYIKYRFTHDSEHTE